MIYSSYQVQATTKIKSYSDLWVWTEKESRAWGMVWDGTWPSRASIMAPGGRDLGRF